MKMHIAFLKRWGALVALVVVCSLSVNAQVLTNFSFVDPSPIANNVQTPFNNTLSWVVGATAVLMVIHFIRKALKLRA